MRRSIGVTISAVVVFIGSAFTLLAAGLMVVGAEVASHADFTQPAFVPYVVFVSAAFLLALAAWGMATGVGLLQLRPWARVSILVFSAMLAIFMIIPATLMLFVPLQVPNNVQDPELVQRAYTFTRVFMVAFYGALSALGVVWLILFSRKSVGVQFDERKSLVAPGEVSAAGVVYHEPPMRRLGRPVSISIISVYSLVSAASIPFMLLMFRGFIPGGGVPAMFFGFFIRGAATVWFFSITAVLQLATGLGLLKLKPWARTLAIFLQVFTLLNFLVSFGLPGNRAKFAQAMAAMQSQMGIQMPEGQGIADPTVFGLMGAGVATLIAVVILWFLVKEKPAFYRPKEGPGTIS